MSVKLVAVYWVTLPRVFHTFLTLELDCVVVRLELVLTMMKYLVAPLAALHLKVTEDPESLAPLTGETSLGALGTLVGVVLVLVLPEEELVEADPPDEELVVLVYEELPEGGVVPYQLS